MKSLQGCSALFGVGIGMMMLSGCGGGSGGPSPASSEKIVFQSNRDGNDEIYIMNPDGSKQTRLTNRPIADTEPVFSPNRSKIAFVSSSLVSPTGPQSPPGIFVMNADGTNITRLTRIAASDTAPAFSPDGRKIAFVSNRDGNDEIYIMNADGSGQTRLTNNPEPDEDPAFSPNGQKIAFSSSNSDPNPNNSAQIFVMNADGTGRTRLTSFFGGAVEPAYSPDGSKIAFLSGSIFLMNADGSGQNPLANSDGREFSPSFSPDGRRLVFASSGPTPVGVPLPPNPSFDIYTVNLDGSSRTRLTTTAQDELSPNWR